MCTRSMRSNVHFPSYFQRDYKIKFMFAKKPFDFYAAQGISERELSQAVKTMESITHHSYKVGYQATYLNPSKALFWVVLHILDYLYQTTFYGGGFSKETGSKYKKLRTKLGIIDNEKKAMEERALLKAAGAPGAVTASAAATRTNTRTAKWKAKKGKDIDLSVRLSLTTKEANVKADLDTFLAEMREALHRTKIRAPERLNRVDQVLKNGTSAMRRSAEERSQLYQDMMHDYSDTDSDDR